MTFYFRNEESQRHFIFRKKKPDDISFSELRSLTTFLFFGMKKLDDILFFGMKKLDDILFFGMKNPDDILFFGEKKLIFRTCEAMAILIYGQKKPSNFYFSTILSSLD